MAWRQDGEAAVLTCTKMTPVRKAVLTRFRTIRGMQKRNLAYASGRGSYRPDLHKKSPVRKAVLTRFLTIRELENRHFAYASGRADDRPDGVLKRIGAGGDKNSSPFDRPIDR